MIFRCNMNHLCGYFQPPELKRGLNKDWPTQPGCQYAFGSCRDRLHLMLKITDRLEEGIIMDILKSIFFQIQKKILLTSLNFVPLATTAIFFFWRKNRSARRLLNDRKTHGPSAQAILESVQFLAYFSPPRLKSTRLAAVQKVYILRLALFRAPREVEYCTDSEWMLPINWCNMTL